MKVPPAKKEQLHAVANIEWLPATAVAKRMERTTQAGKVCRLENELSPESLSSPRDESLCDLEVKSSGSRKLQVSHGNRRGLRAYGMCGEIIRVNTGELEFKSHGYKRLAL